MHWTIAASFIDNSNQHSGQWLAPFVPGNRHQFTLIPRSKAPGNWHNQSGAFTGLDDWKVHWKQGKEAVQATKGGVITVFPQLASTVGMHQQLSGKRVPVVAWLFNVGTCSPGLRRWLAQVSLKNIDRFIVHTRRERQMYSEWLGLPIDRFEFVPYQAPDIPVTYEENTTAPFVTALGSAHRDFATFFEAVKRLNLPTVVASGKRALEGFEIPPQVQTPFGIGKKECLQLAQEARINVVPLLPNERVTAAGQVTIVEAMRMGRPLIATRCNGVEDYIIHGETGWLVEPHSLEDLMQAIARLWDDADLRQRLGQAAQQYATEHFSDEAAGVILGKVLDDVAEKAGMI